MRVMSLREDICGMFVRTNVQKRIKTNKLDNGIAIIFHFVDFYLNISFLGPNGENIERKAKTIAINYTLGETFAASSAVTLFPFSQFLLPYDRVRQKLRTLRCKKRLSYDDSIDTNGKWDFWVPLKNQRRILFCVCWCFGSAKKCWPNIMTSDDSMMG